MSGNRRKGRTGPRPRGPRLWLEPARSAPTRPARWAIRDSGGIIHRTGFGEFEYREAESALAEYIAQKHTPARESNPAQTRLADVISLYATNIAPGHARPAETAARLARLNSYFGTMTTGDLTTTNCQAYADQAGTASTARRDLEDLRAALRHAHAEGLVDRAFKLWMPPAPPPRERWLTRPEMAQLLWTAWRQRTTGGNGAMRADWQHVGRFILVCRYTGTRASAVLGAAFEQMPGRGFVDLNEGVFYRRPKGRAKTAKRQPPIRLPAPLLAHMRRWRNNGQRYLIEYRGQPVARLERSFRSLAAAAGMPGQITAHTLRHTAITWAMMTGENPWEIAGYFGVSLEMITEIYGHHHPDHQAGVVASMGRAGRSTQIVLATGLRQG
jgi:integrase